MPNSSQSPIGRPKISDYLKIAWGWVGILLTLLGGLNNAFKDIEPEWLKTLRAYQIGPIVLILGGVFIAKAAWKYANDWGRYVYARLIHDLSQQETTTNIVEAQVGTQHCGVLPEVQKLEQRLALITTSIAENGPLAEERLFALARGFHDINEAYRDHMAKCSKATMDDGSIRKPFLEKLCGRLAKIFHEAWHIDDAVVTIKRAFKDDDGTRPKRVFTYARSQQCPERDVAGRVNYALDNNTAFQTAATQAHNSRFYFHNNDLRNDPNYRNEREVMGDDWKRYYLSTIVVPIQCKKNDNDDRELIGFLTVDSLHTGVFNTEAHLYVMAAVADQLFNYFRITDEIQASNQAATSGRKKTRDKGKPS